MTANPNIPSDLNADNRTIPFGVGYDMRDDISKETWLALTVDLLRAQLGEDAPVGIFRAEIAERLDNLHAAGLVPRTLSKRYARTISR